MGDVCEGEEELMWEFHRCAHTRGTAQGRREVQTAVHLRHTGSMALPSDRDLIVVLCIPII